MKFKGLLTQDYPLHCFIKVFITTSLCIGLLTMMSFNLFKSGLDPITLTLNILLSIFIFILLSFENKRIYELKKSNKKDDSND